MKRILSIVFFILFFASAGFAGEVKEADLAGSWYPSSDEKLTAMLDGYLSDAKIDKIPPNIRAIIVPHAGYIYSGSIAAYAYKAVSDLDIDTVIVIGFSHRKYYDAISVYDRGSLETPLGQLEVDNEFARELILSNDKIYFNPDGFKDENSVEMQLPIIRHIFKDKDIKVVPISMGVQSYENAEILSDSLHNLLKDRDKYLIIASTDMSHFHKYSEANKIDELAIDTLKGLDPKELFDKVSLEKCEFCGIGTVISAMLAAKKLGADKIEILKYANSGDLVGEKKSVVGYLSAAIYESKDKKENSMLTKEQKKRLLQIARDTIEAYVKTGKMPEIKEDDPALNREVGAFVTIHKHGQLRGCIGNIVGQGPLYLTVRNVAVESSSADPRFPAVTESELKDIDIEISALSELKKVANADEIEMGKHGVLIKNDITSGVYLPQVATETGWSKEEFMSSLCTGKAGLPADAWKKGDVDIYTFTAQVFGEK